MEGVDRRSSLTYWAPSHYPKRCLFVSSRKVSSHEIGTLNCRIALKFDSTAAEVPVKFQSDRTILNTNLVASRLYETLRKYVFSDIETGPCSHQLERIVTTQHDRSVLITIITFLISPFKYYIFAHIRRICCLKRSTFRVYASENWVIYKWRYKSSNVVKTL